MGQQTETMRVEGMTCMHCVMHVKNALTEEVEGVISADISLEKGEATVTYDPERATKLAMKTAVAEAGYTLQV